MRRFAFLLILWVATLCLKAQMTMSFPSVTGVSTRSLTTGATLVEFPETVDLSTVMSGVTVQVGGSVVSNSDITPDPSTLSLTDDEEVTFVYNGSTYSFHFSKGKYFTVVMMSDQHTAQSGHDGTSVANLKSYVSRIAGMGSSGGLKFEFNSLPGYVPTCDLVLGLGDMDGDSEKLGENYKNAHAGFADANIPFITICGNHDLVPDYWTGTNPDKGLTWGWNDGGSYCNDIARGIVEDYCENAMSNGWITDYEQIVDGSSHTQVKPFTFKFNGVRFYMGQTYWFQKTYDKPQMLSSAKYYAPDGVVDAFEEFVNAHKDEASVFAQHYPLVAGSDCDRWWLDQNDVGLYIKTVNASAYGTDQDLGKWTTDATARNFAKMKKDKYAEIMKLTPNPVHFSGHVHSFCEYTYDGIKDYTVASPGRDDGGLAGVFIVLCKAGKGVVEVKQAHVSSDFVANTLDTQVAPLDKRTETVADNTDVTSWLCSNASFSAANGTQMANYANIYRQPEWNVHVASHVTTGNRQYIHLRRRVDDGQSQSLYIRAKWGVAPICEQVSRQVLLPNGTYTLKFKMKQTLTSPKANLCYCDIDGTRTYFTSGSSWTQKSQTFTVEGNGLFTLSFGFVGGEGTNECNVSVANVQLICNSSGAPSSISLNEAKRISKEIYDMQGRRVAVPDKGLYIVGGRKVLIQ